jgi:hypothetical protein
MPSLSTARYAWWPSWATWRSGYAAACKAVYTGSIPVVASMQTACKTAGFVQGDSSWNPTTAKAAHRRPNNDRRWTPKRGETSRPGLLRRLRQPGGAKLRSTDRPPARPRPLPTAQAASSVPCAARNRDGCRRVLSSRAFGMPRLAPAPAPTASPYSRQAWYGHTSCFLIQA